LLKKQQKALGATFFCRTLYVCDKTSHATKTVSQCKGQGVGLTIEMSSVRLPVWSLPSGYYPRMGVCEQVHHLGILHLQCQFSLPSLQSTSSTELKLRRGTFTFCRVAGVWFYIACDAP